MIEHNTLEEAEYAAHGLNPPVPAPVHRGLRFRVNVAISTKGQKTWDCTCDGEGFEMAEVLKMSDALVAELMARYPANVEK